MLHDIAINSERGRFASGPLCPGLGSYPELFPECYLGQVLDIVQPVGRDNKVMPGGGAHGVSISKVP